MEEKIEEVIQKFEDALLIESKDNEDGLLICEIDIFRKHAKKTLSSRDSYWFKKIEEALGEEAKDADDVHLIIDNEKWAHLRNQKMGIACGWNACLQKIKKRLLK